MVFCECYYDYVFGSILTYMFSFKADIVHEKIHQSDYDDQIGYKDSKIDEFRQKDDGFDSTLASSNIVSVSSHLIDISRFIKEPKTLASTGGEAFDPAKTEDSAENFNEEKTEDSVESFIAEKDFEETRGSID